MNGYSIISWVAVLGVMYFLMVRPEQKKQKKMRAMIQSLNVGDNILTRGGIYGKIVSLNDDRVVIVSGSNGTTLEMTRSGILTVLSNAETETAEESENKEVTE